MSKSTGFVVIACLLAGGAAAQSSDLIISEYVEGTYHWDKAIEIYNPTETAVKIGDYHIEVHLITGGLFISSLGPGEIAPGETYVVVDESALPELRALADYAQSSLPFTGVDVVALVRGEDIVVDSIGQRNIDSSSGWSCDEGNTIDHTLRRQTDVCSSDTDLDDVFDPCLVWEFFAVDTFDGLGSHTADCSSVDAQTRTWGSVKASYR